MRSFILLFCIGLVLCVTVDETRFAPPSHRHHFRNIMKQRGGQPAISGPVVNVLDFGADPTATVDSRAKIQSAIDYAFSLCDHEMADGIKDCNGVVINLQGGQYLLSGPLIFRGYTGNWRMTSGTLRADEQFNPDDYLVEVGTTDCPNQQQSCNQGIGFEFMMFDASHQASGAARIDHVMGVNFGPQNFVVGFNRTGIEVNSGHETLVHQCWFGEYYYSDDRKLVGMGTAIVLNGNDHYIVDTIIYGGKIGVIVNGEASVLKGVHTWNCDTSHGGIGIIINAGVTRMENCYLDYNNLIFNKFYLTVVQDTFFLGNGRIIFKPHGEQDVVGFRIANSMYGWGGDGKDTIEIDESDGHFRNVINSQVVDTLIEEGVNTIVQTQVSKKLTQTAATEWTIDFAPNLLFKRIAKVQWSFALDEPCFYRAYAQISGTSVKVVTDVPVTGTLHISVDESEEFSFVSCQTEYINVRITFTICTSLSASS